MEEKINIAELLKDCPKGMELDCTMFDDVSFAGLQNSSSPIVIHTPDGYKYLNAFGCYHDSCRAKCVIFPKGKNTWEGFQRPFKNGDIIYNRLQQKICICYLCEDVIYINHCRYNELKNIVFEKLDTPIPIAIQDYRLATEDEKQKLFQAIKNNGYKWNEEINALEKLIIPRFKVGDTITNGKTSITIDYIDNEYYYEIGRSIANRLFIKNQDEWKLVQNKFDINTLKPYDKVLVRLTNNCIWMPKLFSHYDPKVKYYPFVTLDNMGYPQCIPYNSNEHLCRTTNNCDEFYRVWEK